MGGEIINVSDVLTDDEGYGGERSAWRLRGGA